jgi:hypothetical protein
LTEQKQSHPQKQIIDRVETIHPQKQIIDRAETFPSTKTNTRNEQEEARHTYLRITRTRIGSNG